MNGDVVAQKRRIYTVSELTQQIKELLQETYPFVWICGEISNFRTPVSGHFYFTLKDAEAQIRAVMFRGQNRHLKFAPEDGMAVIAMGRLNVYEPQGVYQVILEYLEPDGIGVLQLGFEQLKARLLEEGLFDEKHKRPLPFLPHTIGVVTSPTGAAIRDIIHVVKRRFPTITLEIAPAKVQGEEAAQEVVSALKMLNDRAMVDVIVVARGGGSLEDLQAFNSEKVARAIFASRIPVVSAVGHETDFTIADFVADVRAPTPSAAAELIVPEKEDLSRSVAELARMVKRAVLRRIDVLRERLGHVRRRLSDPGRQVTDLRLRLDQWVGNMVRGRMRQLQDQGNHLIFLQERLARSRTTLGGKESKLLLERNYQGLLFTMTFLIESKRALLGSATAKLGALSPLAILKRGYSVTRSLPRYTVVKDVGQVEVGESVEVTLARGAMVCCVERKR
jgi:exodeoxyribonuclease VII large subunit